MKGFLVALSLVIVVFLVNPGHAQNSRGCAWPITASQEGAGNILLPETFERYYMTNFDVSLQEMTIKGTFPSARFFSFVAYNAPETAPNETGRRPDRLSVSLADHLYDQQIAPDPGSGVNPFVQSGPPGTYTITLSRIRPTGGNVIHVGPDFVWVAFRVYVPSENTLENGVNLFGNVPLPSVFVGNQQIAQCFPIQKFDDVVALFPDGFDLKGSEGTPKDNRLWFAAPENPPPQLFPNPDNKYLAMLPGDHYQPDRIIVIHGKAPGTPFTFDGSPISQPAHGFRTVDLRYWPLCNNDFVSPIPVVQCTGDLTTELQAGFYTVVISDDLLRPDWLRPHDTWLPYGDEGYPKLVLLRNMLPSLTFTHAVQNTLANCPLPGQNLCTFSFDDFPNTPSRDAIDKAGENAQKVMGDYYPVAVWCDKATYQAGGSQACIKGR